MFSARSTEGNIALHSPHGKKKEGVLKELLNYLLEIR
jgi:hypothetical protein